MDRFDHCFKLVIGVEGGYVNDPHDPGGATIYGITRRDHPDLWLDGPPTLEMAKQRYLERYWYPAQCDKLPAPFDLLVFDSAVNQGIRPAVRILQRALGVADDGVIGKITISAMTEKRGPQLAEAVAMTLAQRALYYAQTRGFDRYGLGWLKRTYLVAMDAQSDLNPRE